MKIIGYDISENELANEVDDVDSKILTSGPVARIYLKALNNILERKTSDYVLKEDKNWFVTKFSSTNIHCMESVRQDKGFSWLKKGDAFDMSKEGFHRADGQGRLYKATSDFKNGYICADVVYNPEI